jgi:8-hydroxy-5-deazaflavin:NADPH oxidoreductase
VAVPGGAIEAALDNVQGLEGKTAIDATNLFGADRPAGFESNAEFVKSRTKGPTAKSFNVNFANQYGELANARSKPGNIWTGDEEARDVVEQLNRDAGYEPLHGGPLELAHPQEDFLPIFAGILKQVGPCVYRMRRRQRSKPAEERAAWTCGEPAADPRGRGRPCTQRLALRSDWRRPIARQAWWGVLPPRSAADPLPRRCPAQQPEAVRSRRAPRALVAGPH